MVVLVDAVEVPRTGSIGYAYGVTEHGREVVIAAGTDRMARLARLVNDAECPVRVNVARARVMFGGAR
jgi:hypothetical protein